MKAAKHVAEHRIHTVFSIVTYDAKYVKYHEGFNLKSERRHWQMGCWLRIGNSSLSVLTTRLLSRIKASFSPANCLSDVPLPPNLVTNFPLDWKMKTQQALLSTVMICPFLSTATPLGPMSRPAPILFWEGGKRRGFYQTYLRNGKTSYLSSSLFG